MAVDIAALRHPKEKLYQTLALIGGGLLWLSFLLSTMGTILIFAGMMAAMLWYMGRMIQASLLGNSALVSAQQYPEIHKMVQDGCKQLGIAEPPQVFVMNGNGAINALAMKLGSGKFVVLYANLIDMMVEQRMSNELKMIICHELGHHAAGHVGGWKHALLGPARMIPFLGGAYSRACEFTADRIGAACTGDLAASKRALVAIAVGSSALKTDVKAFAAQEQLISGYFGRVSEIYASHPRITRRLLSLDEIASLLPRRGTAPLRKVIPAADEQDTANLRQPVHEGMDA